MRDFSETAVALGHSFKQQCLDNVLDVQTTAPRYVAERFLSFWSAGMGPSRFMVKGGLKSPQSVRPTKDADIVTIRRFSPVEINRGFTVIANLLQAEGISVKNWKLQEIDTGGDEVTRYKIEAMCGTIRANFDLDISVATGPNAFPKSVHFKDLPRLFKSEKWPALHAQVQPDEASLAEKWLAVLKQEPIDFQVKHMADVLSYHARGIDLDKVAEEIVRTCCHHGIRLSVCAPQPSALKWRRLSHREASWDKFRAERGLSLTYDQAWIDLNGYWSDMHSALTRNVIRDFRRSVSRPTHVESMLSVPKAEVLQYKPRF